MADDLYSVLGVARGASEDEVRRAYRRLAKELHPDVNPSKAAVERFKGITAAYEILGDAEKRRQYDTGQINERGERRHASQHAYAGGTRRPGAQQPDDFGFSDIFADFFGSGAAGGRAGSTRAHAQKGRDVRYTLDVEFVEAIAGVKKRVTMPEGGVLDLTVPEGVSDGQVLRLKGRGSAGSQGGEPGDALVEVRIRPHALFRRDGNDILLEAPVTLDEAVLGAKVEVPTVSGRVHLTIPKGASSGTVLRLKGKGVKPQGAAAAGDQLVTLRIVLPDVIDEELAAFLGQWREAHRYDPGRR